MDIIGCLPLEISQHILLHLGSEDIDVIWNSIGEWKHIIFDNTFWKKVCLRNNYQEKEECLSSNIYSECMLKHSLHWQAIYTYNRLIQSNWTSDNYKNISITEIKKYSRILWFDDEILIARVDSICNIIDIDIINLSTGNIYFNFNEEETIKKMIKHQNLLIYFLSETLKVLNLETRSWILNLKLKGTRGYSEEIQMKVYNNLLAVINSHFFYVINLETKKLNFKMLNVLDGCFADNTIIVALKSGNKLKVLDLNGKLLMNITYGGRLKVEYIMTKGGYVIICYRKIAGQRYQNVSLNTIHQETESLQEIRNIKVFYQWMLFPNEHTVLFSNRKGRKTTTYKIWRFATENRYVSFDSNEKEMASALANNRYMFLYTEDCILNMWCSETGKFIKDITKKDMELYFAESFEVTEKKFAYINSESCLRILNYDFIAN